MIHLLSSILAFQLNNRDQDPDEIIVQAVPEDEDGHGKDELRVADLRTLCPTDWFHDITGWAHPCMER